jgi:hypothetical protein
MKTKDVLLAVLAVVIMLVAAYIGFTQIAPQKTSTTDGVVVEKIGKISAGLDQAGLGRISDADKVKNFNSVPDFSGLGNPSPFGR